MKKCAKCLLDKDLSDFYNDNRSIGKKTARCKNCINTSHNLWIADNPEKRREQSRRSNKKNWRKYRYFRYGISLKTFDEMSNNQQGLCAICKKPPKSGMLHVDHCHSTGKVRGLLCGPCNTAIGLFEEDLCALESAIKYLELDFSANPTVKDYALDLKR